MRKPPNRWIAISHDLAIIELSQNRWALVDLDMVALLLQYRWSASLIGGTWYAVTCPRKGEKRFQQQTVYMHRLVLDTPAPRIDHINRNGLDNRRSNLRSATHTQNNVNGRGQQQHPDRTSTYRGVSYYQRHDNWRARISIGSVRRQQYFLTELEAAAWYDQQAKELFGEYAHQNLPAPEERH
jgi:HNH endonuclease